MAIFGHETSSREACKQQNYYSTSCAVVNYVYIEYKSPCYFVKFEDSRDGVTWVLFQVLGWYCVHVVAEYLVVNNRADVQNARTCVWTPTHSTIPRQRIIARFRRLIGSRKHFALLIRNIGLIHATVHTFVLTKELRSNKNEENMEIDIFHK